MARVSLDLSQFKSAGVYTIEIDNTERITVTTQSLRLVPGFSTQGPFNTPVFIRSTKDLERFYGPLDVKLEKKGSFFHRSLQTCLLTSPVFAINLLKVDDNPNSPTRDEVEYIGLNLSSWSEEDVSLYNDAKNDLFVNFFNRQRFWTPDPEYLQGVVVNGYGAASALEAPLFQLVNLSTKKLSFIIRKAQGLSQYSVFAKDWYGSENNIPYEWIRPYDLIKDFFIQVIAVEGDWTNYSALSTDPYYSQFFNANGIIPNQLQNFLNSANVNLVGSWVGCIIPDFKDKTGSEQYIETIINGSTPLTGILMNINHQALDQLNWNESVNKWVIGEGTTETPYQVDLVGHNLIDKDDSTPIKTVFLSYDIDVSDAIIHLNPDVSVADSTYKKFYVPVSDAAMITVGSLVKKKVASGEIPGVTYVTSKIFDGSRYVIETAEPAEDGGGCCLTVQKSIDDASIATHYKFIQLDGLTLKNRHLPGFDESGAPSVEEGVKKIYGMLEDPGVRRGLTNPDMIQYRYIVDTMAYGLRSEMGGKAYLSRLAKARGKTTAIINAPSMAQFASSADPYFCDTFVNGVDPTPIFNTMYIPQGGNPDMPRSFKFSFPTEENGSKYSGIFGPFLKYNDGGKIITVPPAADVANAYVRKFLGGDPYAIVANRQGILSNPNIAGVEYNIDKEDRDYLEPFGYNSIIEKPSSGQVMIYSNATAFQTVKSDFNNLHVRELLNTLELKFDEVLQSYVYTRNNAITRLNIVNSITPILETAKDAGAIEKYEITMDESNNTSDIIGEGFGIIDIGVWVTGALSKIVNRITLNRDKGISSGGFSI